MCIVGTRQKRRDWGMTTDDHAGLRAYCLTLRCEFNTAFVVNFHTTLRCEFDCSFGATPYQIARSGLAAAHFLDFADHAMIHFLRLTGNAVCLKSPVTPVQTVPHKWRLAFDSTVSCFLQTTANHANLRCATNVHQTQGYLETPGVSDLLSTLHFCQAAYNFVQHMLHVYKSMLKQQNQKSLTFRGFTLIFSKSLTLFTNTDHLPPPSIVKHVYNFWSLVLRVITNNLCHANRTSWQSLTNARSVTTIFLQSKKFQKLLFSKSKWLKLVSLNESFKEFLRIARKSRFKTFRGIPVGRHKIVVVQYQA